MPWMLVLEWCVSVAVVAAAGLLINRYTGLMGYGMTAAAFGE